jgi:DNA (cytosine-5)-methyltransferase 1
MKTHLDLFSGIGGFALACRWNNIQTIGFCEIEDYPRRVLSKRFPGVPIHRDVRELDGEQYRGVTLITGSYPCQPFSQAGKRKGKEDDRHLWPEMLRVVKQARPAWVLAENVAGHINLGLDEVLADLEGEGYAARAVVVPACAVNAPHRRDRVWIVARDVAHSECERGRSRNFQGEEGEDAGQSSRGEKHRSGNFESRMGISFDGLSEGLDMCRRWGDGSWEEGIPRVTTQKKNRAAKLKALGNAIVPQVAYQIIKAMKENATF